jgi:monovalent cation:H+ antiporter-2, CPA2 family
MDSVFLGAILAISSTTIIVKALEELGLVKERFARLVFGILIVEDMLGIVLIALLSGLAKTGTLFSREAAGSLGLLGVFLIVSLVLGLIAVPRIIGFVARFRSGEMLLVTVLALCFGFTLLTVKLGFSLALGAFLIGAIVAESREHGRIEDLLTPVRDMFSAVFFVSVGLLIDPKLLLEHALPIAVISAAVIAGKVATCSLGTFLAGNDLKTSTRVGMALSQIGEFSFIIAALGLTLGVTSGFLYPIAVSVSALTTLTTPWLIRASDRVTDALERHLPSKARTVMELYLGWLGQLGRRRKESAVRDILRRILGQLSLFLGLIAGAILAAAFLSRLLLRHLPEARAWEWGVQSAFWIAALLGAMPVYVATYRKLKALGMILAELGVPQALEHKAEIRAAVANTFLVLSLLALALFTLALGYAMLPPLPFLAVIAPMLLFVGYRLRGTFNAMYLHGKSALAETLAETPRTAAPESEAAPARLLSEASLEGLVLAPGMAGSDRSLRELELKTRTGVWVVGIERESREIVNPDADEILLPGDRLLLLGNRSQLAAAKAALQGSEQAVP